jgi:spermidine synthase
MPKTLADDHDGLSIEVVEIDPEVEAVGRRFFRLDEYRGRVVPICADARAFLSASRERYDLIFGDVYRGMGGVPAHLLTQEFFALVRRRLNGGGVYMMNLVSARRGERSLLFQSVAKTVLSVFSEVYVFIGAPGPPEAPHNLLLVAPREERHWNEQDLLRRAGSDELAESLIRTYVEPGEYDLLRGVVITDDFNPSELLVARQLVPRRRRETPR